jgi:uncharacterized protein YcbX
MHLAALHLHPVKSLRALSVQSARVDRDGIVGDRRFMVVDPAGVFMTQRTHPRMARVGAFLEGDSLVLRCAGFAELRVGREPDAKAPLVSVSIWKSEGLQAEDCGRAPCEWLGGAIGAPCRLVRIGPAFRRPAKGAAPDGGDTVAFADAYPFLLTSEASLADLNGRLGSGAVPMSRFRPNLVVSGCLPYEEDTWKRLRIGGIPFRGAGPCSRCAITTTDQETGERGVEPLRTLAGYRRDPREPSHVNFGQNLVHEAKSGVLRVGDPVKPLQK